MLLRHWILSRRQRGHAQCKAAADLCTDHSSYNADKMASLSRDH